MKTTGNAIFISGGTSGIGLGLALRFHEAGNKVIVSGRRRALLDKIVAEHAGIEAVALDVEDPASISNAFTTVTSRFPELNVLINMAGIMQAENLLSGEDLQVAETTIATNLLGPIRLIHAFLPFLSNQDHAVIMNVSSGLAFVPLPATPTYSATKAAIHSFTESLRVQLADSKVEVLELVPPATQTTLMDLDKNPHAMPLDDFLSEVMALLSTQSEATQVIVDRAKRQRFAVANGNYDEVLAAQSGRRY